MKKKDLLNLLTCFIISMCSLVLTSCESDNEAPGGTLDNHVHAFGEWETTKRETCTENGEKARYCSCGDIQTAVIAATGHIEVVEQAVEPGCTTNGYTEGKHCSVCNEVLVEQNVVEPKGHVWGNPTCTTPRSCLECWEPDPDSIPLGHSYVQGECEVCGDSEFNDTEPAVTASELNVVLNNESEEVYITLLNWDSVEYEIDNSSIVLCEWGEWDGDVIPLTFIPVSHGKTFVSVYPEGCETGIVIEVSVNLSSQTPGADSNGGSQHTHSYSTNVVVPTCTEQGYTIYTCGCGYVYNSDYVSANGHTEVIDPAVEATATSTGLTEGKHCSVCGTVLVKQEVVPKNTSNIDNTTFVLTNDLSQEYSYVASKLYTKCKIENISHEVSATYNGKVQLKITMHIKKTVQGETSNKNLKLHYTLYRNGVAVQSRDITIINTELDTVYEEVVVYTGEPGEYTMTCKSIHY